MSTDIEALKRYRYKSELGFIERAGHRFIGRQALSLKEGDFPLGPDEKVVTKVRHDRTGRSITVTKFLDYRTQEDVVNVGWDEDLGLIGSIPHVHASRDIVVEGEYGPDQEFHYDTHSFPQHNSLSLLTVMHTLYIARSVQRLAS